MKIINRMTFTAVNFAIKSVFKYLIIVNVDIYHFIGAKCINFLVLNIGF